MTARQKSVGAGTTRGAKLKRPSGDGWIVCRHTCAWQPPTDVYEGDDGAVVRIELAGMRSDDFSISLTDTRTRTGTGCTLVIAGTRTDPIPKRIYHQMEIHFGEFRAEVRVPWPVEPEDVEATYEEGFLTVSLPRPRPRRVPVIGVDNVDSTEVHKEQVDQEED